MDKMVKELATQRAYVAKCKDDQGERLGALHNTPEYLAWVAARDLAAEAEAVQSDMEAALRNSALGRWMEDGNATPHPAVKVKMFTTYTYNPFKAKEYAREHLPAALKLDAKAFEKAAAVLGLDFVDITREPQAQIASDLSKYVEEG